MKLISFMRWLGVLLVAGSATVQAGIFKAAPAPPSGFLSHVGEMCPDNSRAPFNKVWRNPSLKAWERVQNFDKIVILPVRTSYLNGTPCQRAEAQRMAAYMRAQFEKQFACGGEYRVVNKPGPRTLVLDMALVEWKTTNVPGNVVSTGAGVVVPGANMVGSIFTHGNIAFEAKLYNGQNGQLLAEYADRQRDKLSIFSFRDYSPTAHNRRAVDDWAKQMEELARTPASHRVSGAMAVTLNPF